MITRFISSRVTPTSITSISNNRALFPRQQIKQIATKKMSQQQQQQRVGILWFRNDLRLHDNSTLNQAIELLKRRKLDAILPVYVFDSEMLDGKSRQAALPRCGPYRRNFQIESVQELRSNLRLKLGSDLLVAYGQPVKEIVSLVDEINGNKPAAVCEMVLACKEIAWEEVVIERELERALLQRKSQLQLVWDLTMIHVDDLPYQKNMQRVPDVFTQFRRNVELRGIESNYDVRKPIGLQQQQQQQPQQQLATYRNVAAFTNGVDRMPELAASGLGADQRSAIGGMRGGESEALKRTDYYYFKSKGLHMYGATRNGLIGADYSSKLSMWLANGCVSARHLYWLTKEYEAKHGVNESTKKFVFELLWRDFFKFNSHKHGRRLFYLGGHLDKYATASAAAAAAAQWSTDLTKFDKWCRGETGYPFVDANMKEMNATGWMSNRGRQNVASFLTKDLAIDWRFGAEYFEAMLIDYDTTSNWGNWQYLAGVGADPRADRYFNVIKQAYDYDEQGEYAKMWLPQLAQVSAQYVHCPFKMSLMEQRRVNCVIGKDYAEPMVKTRVDWNPTGPRKVNKFAVNSKKI